LLKLAASGVAVLLDELGCSSNVPPQGASRELLVNAVDGNPDGAPLSDPVHDPAGFVRALIAAAFQTGDGDAPSDGRHVSVDYINQACSQQLELAAQLITDTNATLRASLDNACGAVEALLAKDVDSDDLSSKAQRVMLSQSLEWIAAEAKQIAELATTETYPKDEGMDGAAVVDDDEDSEPPPKRTKSQVERSLQVKRVKQNIADREGPVHELARTASHLSKGQVPSEMTPLREALSAVDQAQKKGRNFGEDLLEDMLALDKLSGLKDEDRQARKSAIRGIESLLEAVDNSKSRLVAIQRKLESKLKEQEQEEQALAAEIGRKQREADAMAAEEELQSKAAEIAKVKDSARAVVKRVGESPPPSKEFWSKLRLPLRFHSREQADGYNIVATIPGLSTEDISVELSDDSQFLTVEGIRFPGAKDSKHMRQKIGRRLQQEAQANPRSLVDSVDTNELYAELGQGDFGKFSETFRVPVDAIVDGMNASYSDGVLRIHLPRKPVYPVRTSDRLGGFGGGRYGGNRGLLADGHNVGNPTSGGRYRGSIPHGRHAGNSTLGSPASHLFGGHSNDFWW
jgi:HSP20 family molecular chaperone IbpA